MGNASGFIDRDGDALQVQYRWYESQTHANAQWTLVGPPLFPVK